MELVTKQVLSERLADLRKQEDELIAQLNMVLGAQRECAYWFEKLSQDAPQEG